MLRLSSYDQSEFSALVREISVFKRNSYTPRKQHKLSLFLFVWIGFFKCVTLKANDQSTQG